MAVLDSDRQEKGDVIYRQDAISVLGAQCKDEYNKTCGKDCECMEYMALRDLPSAQPERKTGRWEYLDYGGFGNWHCTSCGKIAIVNGNEDYCPNCGADMRESE